MYTDNSIARKLDDGTARLAIEEGRVIMQFQPQISCGLNKVVGMEALARIFDEKGKELNTQEVILHWEKTGQIHRLDYYMFERVCQYINRMQTEQIEICSVSVNFSQYTIMRNDMLEIMQGLIKKYEVPINSFKIEVTETATKVDGAKLKEKLYRLKTFGVRLSLDDLVCGSFLAPMISEHIFEEVKIDKSLTDAMLQNSAVFLQMQAISRHFRRLGVFSVVEGVDDFEKYKAVCKMDFDAVQGFFVAMPMLPAQATEFYSKNSCVKIMKCKK